MSTAIEATFDVTNWDEHEFDRHAGAGKLTKAKVTKSYHGDISADSLTEWLMSYSDDGTASFVGLERIIGSVGQARGNARRPARRALRGRRRHGGADGRRRSLLR